jgi:hypothetical protein
MESVNEKKREIKTSLEIISINQLQFIHNFDHIESASFFCSVEQVLI